MPCGKKKFRSGGGVPLTSRPRVDDATASRMKTIKRIDLDKVRADTTARDNAAAERRYRRALGSDAQINARANRSRAIEAGEDKLIRRAKGGSVSSRADGIAKKGKTKGKMLAKGGKC